MLRGFSRVSRLLLAFTCVSLLAASAEASPILIDGFGAFPDSDLPIAGAPMFTPTGGGGTASGAGTFNYVAGTGVTLEYALSGPFDLTDAGSNYGILISGLFLIPPAGPVNLTVTLTDSTMDERTATVLGLTFAVPGPQSVEVPFSSFMGDASFGFEEVQMLKFEFTSLTDMALSIDEITAVPEPSTALLLGLGLFGLAVAGRRQTA